MGIIENTINVTETETVTEERKENVMEEKTFRNHGRIIIDEAGNFLRLTEQELERLINRVKDIINFCGKNGAYPELDGSEEGLKTYVLTWFENKRKLIQRMANSPFFDEENYRLEFEKGISKTINTRLVKQFIDELKNMSLELIPEVKYGNFSYKEVREIVQRLDNIEYNLTGLPSQYLSPNAWDMWREQADFFKSLFDKYTSLKELGRKRISNEDYKKFCQIRDVADLIKSKISYRLTDEMAKKINDIMDLQCKENQKTSRVLNKLAKLSGYDQFKYDCTYGKCKVRKLVGKTSEMKNDNEIIMVSRGDYHNGDYILVDSTNEGTLQVNGRWGYDTWYVKCGDRIVWYDGEWNYEDHRNDYSAYSAAAYDALIERVNNEHLFLSVDIIDLMCIAIGTNWGSCMTMDIDNIFGTDRTTYHGMFSGGISSYVHDKVTVCLFGINEDGKQVMEENNYPVLLKKMRQLFHIHDNGDVIIQGRLYPYDQTDQGNSCEPEDYVQYRQIVQELVTELWGKSSNDWIKASARENWYRTTNGSLHYQDYSHYTNPNATYRRGVDMTPVMIGHRSICPKCGNFHDNQKNIFCYSCVGGENNVEHFCDYHDEWETLPADEWHYSQSRDAYICDDGYDAAECITCERCGDWQYEDDYIYVNGNYYCCDTCAERDGNTYLERYSTWYSDNDITYSVYEEEYVPTYEEDVVFATLESGETDAVYKEHTIEYDGRYYIEDDCVTLPDGTLVPKWLTEESVDDETGEVVYVVA